MVTMTLPGSVRIASQDEVGTRLGRTRTMGFVNHGPALLPRPRRVLDAYALVLVREGVGSYVDDAVGHLPITAGDAIITAPGHSHWYGPPPGGLWSETFLVFDGPIFDALAAHDDGEQAALYPLLQALAVAPDVVARSLAAHSLVKRLIDYAKAQEGPPLIDAVAALEDAVTRHVRDEEQNLLPALQAAATDQQLQGLAARWHQVQQRVG